MSKVPGFLSCQPNSQYQPASEKTLSILSHTVSGTSFYRGRPDGYTRKDMFWLSCTCNEHIIHVERGGEIHAQQSMCTCICMIIFTCWWPSYPILRICLANWRPWIPLQVCIRHINVINDHLAGTVSPGWKCLESMAQWTQCSVFPEDPNPLFDLRIGALEKHADLIRGSLHVWSLYVIVCHCSSSVLLFSHTASTASRSPCSTTGWSLEHAVQ